MSEADPEQPVGGGAAPGARRVAIVPHTHWDREWYDPFQAFRVRLVRLVDDLLDLLEGDAGFRHFLLDGQLAAVDDYLEIRPENEHRLAALAGAGRLSFGPWYVLPDEFLVSGETLVRNLQAGIARASSLGGTMEVGYLPDMFGHVGQMPQLLTLAGFGHAVVWRGVPSAVDRTAFWWEGPDGSTVRAEYLVAGYGNGAAIPDDPAALLRRLAAHLEEVAPFLRPGDPLLFMNGTDHLRPQPWLARVVAEADAKADDVDLAIVSLEEYLAGAPRHDLPRWAGELRSGARANVLMGVTSNRVDVRAAAAEAERSLERWAEPLWAAFLPADRWPRAFLDVAWRNVVLNAAHDSVCACSADEVVHTVLDRYHQARQIGDTLTAEALAAIGSSMAAAGPVVVNVASRERGGMVEAVVAADHGPGPDVQVLSERAGLPGTMELDAATVVSVLSMIQGARLDADLYVTGVTLTEDADGLDLAVTVGTQANEAVAVDEVKRDLFTRLSAHPETRVRIHLDQPPIRRVLARSAPVPGFGWSTLEVAPLAHPAGAHVGDDGTVTLANGLTTVTVDPRTGLFALDGVHGLGLLVDGGDHGDTYNYSPPLVDTVVDTPRSVVVEATEHGPVRATVVVTSTYDWPAHVGASSSARVGSVPTEVRTTLELRADERVVRIAVDLDNRCRDHRLRMHFPLPHPAHESRAGTAFDTVTRGLTAEGRPEELGLPTFVARGFVAAGGLTVVADGAAEYELVDMTEGPDGPAAHTLAITVLRATGMLSRVGMVNRILPAGPLDPIEGAQVQGPLHASFAVVTGPVDPYALADDVLVPLAVSGSFGGGDRPARGSALAVTGAEVSSVRRVDGSLEVRLFNPTDDPVSVDLGGRAGELVDLRGRPLAPVSGGVDLRPHGIATVRLGGP